MASDKKLDLFWMLKQLDNHNINVLDGLDADQKKEVSNYMLLRWLSGSDDPEQLEILGTIATSCLFGLSKHPDLMTMVLACCTRNGPKRYRWINYKGTAKESPALELVMNEWQLTRSKAEEALKVLNNDDIMALAERHGYQPDELKKLKKELA